MKNALGRCPALVATFILAGGCDGDAPALTGSCRYECLNQIRHLFEQCTSPWGTACQGQAPDPSGHLDCETDYAYLDPEDSSCIPYGMPGSPAWVPDNTLACATGGTCAIP